MPLPAKPTSEIADLRTEAEVTAYFNEYARRMPDAPKHYCYQIRIGGHTLMSEDTHKLRGMFGRAVGLLHANEARRRGRKP